MKTISLVLSQKAIHKYRYQDVTLRDVNVPYLFFRYSKADKHIGSFHLGFTSNGKSTSRVLGRFPLLSIKAARISATLKRQSFEAIKYSATKLRRFKCTGDLLNWYREFRCNDPSISLNTKRNIEHQIDRVLQPTIGGQDLSDFSVGFVSEVWLNSELVNYQMSTLKNSFQCLKGAFNRAHKLGYIQTNPLINICFSDISPFRLKPRENRIQFWSIQKLIRLINGLPTEFRMLCLLCLGYLTRNQETAMARWEHFDFNKKLWHIPAENTKTGQGITHPITSSMAVILKRYRKWQLHKTRSKFLFPQKRGYRPISASLAAKKIAQQTNNKFRLHDLRKYGSTALRDMGTDYYIVERILNHKMTSLDHTYIQTTSWRVIEKGLSDWHQMLFS